MLLMKPINSCMHARRLCGKAWDAMLFYEQFCACELTCSTAMQVHDHSRCSGTILLCQRK